MALVINTNIPSLVAVNRMHKTQTMFNSSLAKLSSGSRITKSADDAAGLAISDKLTANIRSTNQAARNASDGVSLIQTAEGGLSQISDILVRLRELGIQAASDTIGDQERQFSDHEFQNLISEIDRISKSTEFNGKKLISGEGESLEFQVGINNNPEIDRIVYSPEDSNAGKDALGVGSLNILTKADAQDSLAALDDAIGLVNSNRATLGALQNRLQMTIENLHVSSENLSAANSQIRDADIAQESANFAKASVLMAANTAMVAQANTTPQIALRLIA